MMTPRGTFIINGVEKVVISQINRSPGVYLSRLILGVQNYLELN